METPAIYVYLWFTAITDEQRDAFLERLANVLPVGAAVTERYGRPCVRVEGPDENAAFIQMDRLVTGVRSEIGLAANQVTCGLDPRLLPEN